MENLRIISSLLPRSEIPGRGRIPGSPSLPWLLPGVVASWEGLEKEQGEGLSEGKSLPVLWDGLRDEIDPTENSQSRERTKDSPPRLLSHPGFDFIFFIQLFLPPNPAGMGGKEEK